ESIPDVALRTTMLVGYPGETDDDFRELLQFVKESRFERLGVFTYSQEEGTSSFDQPDDVPEKLKQLRLEELLAVQQQVSLELNEAKVGQEFKVIIDRQEGDLMIGRTEYDSPEVDNEVIIRNTSLKPGEFYDIRVISASEFDLIGEKI
ncbi:MAG: TRAM domain-containing protein, partial [Bacteroidales bacterium]|nr:TRAM domain-containing protein [Bacteroidales bacterium]